jgi:DNA helicase II / ATP-dependent DNA helicase PcrA
MFVNDGLNAEQQAAVHHEGRNLLIVAGAGTGKTTTLAARLAHLVETGVPPERILLLTFSRRAAAEMLHRVESAAPVGSSAAAAVWGGTFHAIGNRLLRRYGGALGLEPGFTVLDPGDAADLMALVREEHTGSDGLDRRRARKETLVDVMSRCVNAREPLTDVLYSYFPWCTEDRDDMRKTFAGYIERKRARQLLDYDDLLMCWWALLQHDDTANALRSLFDHVLVDEYQDTNALQADVLEAMVAGGTRLTVVGDDAQAIYSFRAATHANIMNFADRFDADVVKLVRNHRSTPPILATANAVIAEARHRHEKTLEAVRPGSARPVLVRCYDEATQAVATCERILAERERGTSLRQQAVLVRSGHHSDLVELELTARHIPYVKYGGLKFLEAAHVKDLVSALRLVENPLDELAYIRVLQLLDGVGRATARTLVTEALVANDDPLEHLAAHPACGELVQVLREAALLPEDATVAKIERVRLFLEPLVENRYENWPARVADFDQLQLAAEHASSLSRFLVELTLDPPAATGDLAGPPMLDDDVLTVSTIHSAKGGEWDVVHVLHVVDGNVPSDMATGDAEGIEEERRLLYVALTRARNQLHVYAPLRYHHQHRGKKDKHGYAQLSRFLTPAVLATMDDETVTPLGGGRDDALVVTRGRERLDALDSMVAGLFA